MGHRMLERSQDCLFSYPVSVADVGCVDLGMDEGEDEPVPLPNVNAAILKKVIQWCTYHKDDPQPAEDDENKEKRTDDICTWDVEFLKVDQGTLFELILVSTEQFHISCIFRQRTGRRCSLLTSCSFTYSCKTILNERGLMHRDNWIFESRSTSHIIKTIELNIIYNYYIIFRPSSMIKAKTTTDTPTTESRDYRRTTTTTVLSR